MSGAKDGGPALVCFELKNGVVTLSSQLTIRDYFAAKAMQGMMARDSFDPGQASPTQRAHLAYLEADSMLSEREKGGAA